ncbi:MAG: DUF2378 family protein [Deltaproteobacteria bacterium]|nr:DUF2378 family protein [Deltaproteobacteria bacterium]
MSDVNLQAAVFSATFEGVARRFRNQMSAGLISELRARGLDFDDLKPAYPLELWEFLVRRLSSELYPGVPEAAAWRRLGREFIEGYAQTLIGRSTLALGRIIGTRRFMERLGRNLRSGGNFAQVDVHVIAPNEVQIESRIDPAFLAHWAGKETVMHQYRVGVVEGALLAVGAKPDVELLSVDPARQMGTYRARWT